MKYETVTQLVGDMLKQYPKHDMAVKAATEAIMGDSGYRKSFVEPLVAFRVRQMMHEIERSKRGAIKTEAQQYVMPAANKCSRVGRAAAAATSAVAMRTILDTWSCPNGMALRFATGDDLRTWADTHARQAAGALHNARFYSALSKRVRPSQKVGEVVSAEEASKLLNAAKVEARDVKV